MCARNRPPRRAWLGSATLLLVVASLGCSEPTPARKPDVVLVVLDTLRADRLSCYGYPRPTSPFLDRLASEGALFEDVTCQFSWTRPSMVSMFHGRYLTSFRDALHPEIPSLAEVFRSAGYRTVGVVANQLVNEDGGFARGFDHFDVRATSAPGDSNRVFRDLAELGRDLWDPLGQAMEAGDGERPPLLVYIHALDPHAPYEPHADLDAELPIDEALPVEPPEWLAETMRELGPPGPEGDRDWSRGLRQLHHERGLYDQGVRYTDRELEKIFDRLRELGVLEHAIVAVVSDHGESLWEHVTPLPPDELAELPPYELFYQSHGASQYQEVITTPFILWGEGVPAGLRLAQPVENVDLFPTLLELADVATPGGLQGRSLVPLMERRPDEWREFVFAYGVHGNAVREPKTGWKLILPRGNALQAGHGPKLFDVRADPHERHDVSAENPEVVERLVRAWKQWRDAYPIDDNLSAAMGRRTDREHQRLLKSLGYTDLDVGGGE